MTLPNRPKRRMAHVDVAAPPPHSTVALDRLGSRAVQELIAAVPGTDGHPFLNVSTAVHFAVNLTHRVIAAGELDRFGPPPLDPLATPASCTADPEQVSAFLRRYGL